MTHATRIWFILQNISPRYPVTARRKIAYILHTTEALASSSHNPHPLKPFAVPVRAPFSYRYRSRFPRFSNFSYCSSFYTFVFPPAICTSTTFSLSKYIPPLILRETLLYDVHTHHTPYTNDGAYFLVFWPIARRNFAAHEIYPVRA